MATTIRPARPDDLERLIAVEIDAGLLFLTVDMAGVAGCPPPSVEELGRSAAVLVAVDAADLPVGYARLDVVDGHAHLHQLSVARAHGRRGVGRALLAAAVAWAAERGDREITLTTFTDVPWNGPWYQRCGFTAVAAEDLGPELRAVLAREAAHGLDASRRLAMRLSLPVRQGPGPTPPPQPHPPPNWRKR